MINWCDKLEAAIEAREATPWWRLIRRRRLLNAIEFLLTMCTDEELGIDVCEQEPPPHVTSRDEL